LKKIKNYY